jgi:hypothetical protein
MWKHRVNLYWCSPKLQFQLTRKEIIMNKELVMRSAIASLP